MTDEIRVGSRVRCGVYVLGEWVPMHVGIVTRDHGDGSYDVDRMSLHGGAAWVHRERNVRLEPSGVAWLAHVSGVMASDARHCGNCADGVPGGPDKCSKCGREQQYSHWTPRFQKTYCSQCGGEFGPGDEGFSHCSDQVRSMVPKLEDEPAPARPWRGGEDEMTNWLSTRPTSNWQRGCNDARAGRRYNPPSDGMDSYRNGYEFGKGNLSDQQIDAAYREAWADRKVVFNSPVPVEVLRAFARNIQRVVTRGVTPTVPARPRGVHALADVVSNLLQTGRYSDEEGEATAELLDLLKGLTDGALVPATPTQAMLNAADKVLDSDPRHIAEAWRVMVAAAGVAVPLNEQEKNHG
jgi:hypothetical protein